MRGTVQSPAEFAVVVEAVNTHLRRIFGVTMQTAGFNVRTVDGKKCSDTVH